jgi:hypothetical protein
MLRDAIFKGFVVSLHIQIIIHKFVQDISEECKNRSLRKNEVRKRLKLNSKTGIFNLLAYFFREALINL